MVQRGKRAAVGMMAVDLEAGRNIVGNRAVKYSSVLDDRAGDTAMVVRSRIKNLK